MKKNDYLLMTLLICFMGISCKKDDPSTVSVSVSSVELTAVASSQPVSVTSNTDWTVSGGASWLTLTPSSGSGNASIVVTATENKDFTSRNCTLTISTTDGEASASVTVKQDAADLKLSVDVNELNFSEKEGDLQHLSIISNSDWRITGKPEWLDLSSTSGSGNATIKLTTNEFNSSSSARQETLVVTANGVSVEVKVNQKAGLVADCVAELTNVVVLSDAVAFSFEYGSSVSYYYVGYLDKTDVGRMTDDEIIKVLDTEFERYTPSDDWVISFNNLKSQHDYVIYTVAYDKNGKRGELMSADIRTKSGVNQPFAYVDNVEYDSSYWYWDTVIGAYSSKYYQWVMTGDNTTDYWSKVDAIVAWRFAYYMNKYPDSFGAILQSDGWYRERKSSERYIQIVTWGADSSDNLAGVINNVKRYIKATTKGVLESVDVSSENNVKASKVVAVELNDLFDDVKIYRIK